MEEITKRLRDLPMPSRQDRKVELEDTELEEMFLEITRSTTTNQLINFRKLCELATARPTIDELTIRIYEASLVYSLEMGDMARFVVCGNRLVNELYGSCSSPEGKQEIVTSLLLLFYAADTSRNGDFASVFYKISDQVRRSEPVQYSLEVYMALKRCDYASWGQLVAKADKSQACMIRVFVGRANFRK